METIQEHSSPNLHQSLLKSLANLKTEPNQPRKLILTTVRSKAYHTHSLFPHATHPNQIVLKTDYLVHLAERIPDYLSEINHQSSLPVPIFALEASLYTLPTAHSALLYISKVDSTGLGINPVPATILTEAFISYFFDHPPRSIDSIRVHIFARAAREGQYLFPGSASNVIGGNGDGVPKISHNYILRGKRILDDQQLIKWWKTLLSKPIQNNQLELQRFYILPGFDKDESLSILPNDHSNSNWNYGHSYHHLPPIFSIKQLGDLIPALPDDPKARFLQTLSRSSANPAGEPGDWDDAIEDRCLTSLEIDRLRERKFLNQINVDEFWERMGGRQECCDGRVSAFFVIFGSNLRKGVIGNDNNKKVNEMGVNKDIKVEENDVIQETTTSDSISEKKSDEEVLKSETSSIKDLKTSSAVSRNVWVTLWSKFHNVDYSKLHKSSIGYQNWIESVKACVGTNLINQIHTEIQVDNPNNNKRNDLNQIEERPITILQPRKKVKKTSVT